MATQHNIFIRKFGKWAIAITVTDWNDFKELEQHSKHSDPDFLLSAVTDRSIYSNMNPSMLISTKGEVKDITEDTVGFGLAGIITGSSPAGPLWQFRKISGLNALTGYASADLKDQHTEG